MSTFRPGPRRESDRSIHAYVVLSRVRVATKYAGVREVSETLVGHPAQVISKQDLPVETDVGQLRGRVGAQLADRGMQRIDDLSRGRRTVRTFTPRRVHITNEVR